MKGCLLCVGDGAQILRHNPVKHVVGALQHLPAASEILVKLNLLIETVFLRVGMVLFQKQLRSGQAEFVNTLLYIPYHKHIGCSKPFSGHCPDKGLLHQIAVLILIHQDLVKLTGQKIGRLAGPVFSPLLFLLVQHLKGQMLQIVKIHQVSLPLLRLKPSGKILRQRKEHENCLAASCQICKDFLLGGKQKLSLHLLHSLLDPLPALRHLLLFIRVHR